MGSRVIARYIYTNKKTFPFKTEFVENVRESQKIQEADPDTWHKIESALTTKINERPYISFIDPLKGDEE